MGLMKVVVTDALLETTIINPKADLTRPEFGFYLAPKNITNARLAEALMYTLELPLIDFV